MCLNTDTVIRRTDKAILYLHILAARNINTISCYNSGHDIHIINDNMITCRWNHMPGGSVYCRKAF